MSKNTPFRYDYVGSFLRPETLKRARRDFEEGKISKEELTKSRGCCNFRPGREAEKKPDIM